MNNTFGSSIFRKPQTNHGMTKSEASYQHLLLDMMS